MIEVKLIKSLVLLNLEFFFREERSLNNTAIETAAEQGDFGAFSFNRVAEQRKSLRIARHRIGITVERRSGYDHKLAVPVLLHLVLNIELQLDVVKSLLDFLWHD